MWIKLKPPAEHVSVSRLRLLKVTHAVKTRHMFMCVRTSRC